jgi:uracil-DNA glycosylase
MIKPTKCQGCPFIKCGTGFAHDWVSIGPPKIMVVMKMPAREEVVSGKAGTGGAAYYFWKDFIFPMGLRKDQVTICNVLRCVGEFPIGKMRREAIEACRRWDDPIREWKPDVMGISFSPSGLLKTPQQTRFLKKSIERAVDFASNGQKPLLLLGDEAREKFLPHLSGGLKTWQGSWFNYENKPEEEVEGKTLIRR